MKATPTKLRSPLKWHGGKSYLARRIIALFPPHTTYVEPFAGGLSVLLNKPESKHEIANDVNPSLINSWKCLRDLSAFRVAIDVPYSRYSFDAAKGQLDSPDPLVRAAAFMTRNRMSRGGLGKDFAWSERQRGGQPGDMNAWKTSLASIPTIVKRVQRVGFHNHNALRAIAVHDGPTTLFYCDPPYLHETRTHKRAYEFEMTREDHERLLSALLGCKAKVFLSGYRSPLYDDALGAWKRHEFDMPNHSGQGRTKQRRMECVWESPNP